MHDLRKLIVGVGVVCAATTMSGCRLWSKSEKASTEENKTPVKQPAQASFTQADVAKWAVELVSMGKADRDVRDRHRALVKSGKAQPSEIASVLDEMNSIDQSNTAKLRTIVDAAGWPTKARFGPDAAKGAWTVAQHADGDPEFQARVLELTRPLVSSGEIQSQDYARLTDRVRIAQGRPQLYGTQFQLVRGEDGSSFLIPSGEIENPEKLNERRAQVGLGTHEDYVARLQQAYGIASAE